MMLVAFIAAGCAPSNPHDLRVTALDGGSLIRWRSQVGVRFAGADWAEFDDALLEVRRSLMFGEVVSGSEAVETVLCRRIHGLAVRDVLLLGHQAALDRLERERLELRTFAAANAWLITRPGDASSASYLEAYRARQQRRLDAAEAGIARATRRILALGGSPVLMASATSSPAIELSRPEALAEIDRVIEKLRQVGLLRFGAWPVRIDPDGRRLPTEMRAGFAARRTAAETAGRAVIAVRVRNRWLIYDGPREAPQLPSFVAANLTALDRTETEAKWLYLQAELWARETAGGLTADEDGQMDVGAEQRARVPPARILQQSNAAALKELGDRQRLLRETSKLIDAEPRRLPP